MSSPQSRTQTAEALAAKRQANTATGVAPAKGVDRSSFLGTPTVQAQPGLIQPFVPSPDPATLPQGQPQTSFLGRFLGMDPQVAPPPIWGQPAALQHAYKMDQQTMADIARMKPFNDAIAARQRAVDQYRLTHNGHVNPMDLSLFPPVDEGLLPK